MFTQQYKHCPNSVASLQQLQSPLRRSRHEAGRNLVSTKRWKRLVCCRNSAEDVSVIITDKLFNEMLPFRNDHRCPAKGFYTCEAFLAAASCFPGFGTTGTTQTRRRELAAFFGQTSYETSGAWKLDVAEDEFARGYCHVREARSPSRDYCKPCDEWPCVTGQQYYGRGPIQLTFNFNYGPAGEALGLDLLSNPDLVATDAVVSLGAAIWFWMTPRDDKPSCHDVIVGAWTPNEADLAANRLPGYGLITNIINQGECGHGADKRVANRIGFFERYCSMLGVEAGDNLDCYHQCSFSKLSDLMNVNTRHQSTKNACCLGLRY